ncbi:MAG: thiaminase II, partial [Pseudomonadota bacterium]
EVGLAALLPCFWIYREVGRAIQAQADGANPYRAWIDTYAGEDFAEAVDQVIATIDGVAAECSRRSIERMHLAYRRSAQLEWMFWDSAYRLEGWPV